MLAGGAILSLYIGPAVPIPASREVLEALTGVQVMANTEKPSVFQLTFRVGKNSPLQTLFMLAGGAMPPLVRVLVVLTIRGTANVLMDGVLTAHQMLPGKNGEDGTLTLTGEDLSRVMNYLPLDGIPYPAMPDFARAALILAKYAVFGVIPLVIPSVLIDVPIPTERFFRQGGTDLQYLNKLASEVGYTFYVDPGPVPGASIAYWGPPIKVGAIQPALTTDSGTATNVETLSFRFDDTRKVLPLLMVQEPLSKVPIPIPVPDITPLSPPLGLIPPIPKQTVMIQKTAKYSFVKAAAIGLAMASKYSDAVFGEGTLDVTRYGRLLKARQLVGVRGAGLAFDGLYFVKSVTTSIKRGEIKQNFSLARNGLISTVPKVPV